MTRISVYTVTAPWNGGGLTGPASQPSIRCLQVVNVDDGITDETLLLRNLLPKEDCTPVQTSIWAIRACNVVNHVLRVSQAVSQ